MKHLIVYSHPNPRSFNRAILDTAEAAARSKGHEVAVRDLYGLKFDPVLKGEDFVALQAGKPSADVAEEQRHVAWADLVTFVHPIWWTGLPAILKGYIDRVFSHGFAYALSDQGPVGLLKEKKVLIFNTTGTPEAFYGPSGMLDALKKTSDTGIYQFCGMQVVGHHFFCGVPFVDDAARQAMLEQVRRIVSGL